MRTLWQVVNISAILLLTPGCATWYYHKDREPLPSPISVKTSPQTVGVTINPNSKAPQAASVSPTQVVELFVKRMQEDAMFRNVIFPYSQLSQTYPSLIFDVTVKNTEELHWAENMVKAVLTGATFFILTPVLPLHFGFAVDLDVKQTEAGSGNFTQFKYISQYEFKYWFYPKRKAFEEWLKQTQLHAVEHVLNQIKKANFKE